MARPVRHRSDRNGASTSLTPAASVARSRATAQLLSGAAAVLALALGRATAIRAGVPDVLPAAIFAGGLLLAALAMQPGGLSGPPAPRSLILGAALGGTLLVPGVVMHAGGAVGAGAVLPHGYLVLWAPLMALVAAGEEAALRGWLQPLARESWGPLPAIFFLAGLFAAVHAPVYGWVALPLDFGVGLLIGCLRECTRSVAACGLAHFVADLGHWWLP